MDLGLLGRRALVTGASKGIGFATADRLAREGCEVHLVARSESQLEQAAARLLERASVTVRTWPLDLSQSDNIDRLFRTLDEEAFGEFDIVVNNAGAIPAGNLESVDEAAWRAAWDLKVFGYINLTREVYRRMKQAAGGVIINIIGAAGERPMSGYIAGSAGNAALMAMTRALGSTSARHGIRVVAINPGLIETERMVQQARLRAEARFDDAERWQEMIPTDFPPGRPEHVADMVAFLASDRSAYTTGTVITIDGGSSSR
jgi:NAD(P)-dependent dehydrogenase (short-subunit alcohol dehydrogenase family)